MRPALLGAVLATALTLSGCGTTVDLRTATAAGDPGLGSVGQPPAEGVAPAVPGGGVTPGAASTAPGEAPATASGTTPSTVRSTAAAATRALPPLKVGIVYDHGTDSYAKSFGLGFLSTGDGRSQGQAFVDFLNAHGGLAGRKVVPVFAPMETSQASSSGPDQAQASVCAALTQDDHVVLAVGNLAPQASFLQCLHKAHVPYVTGYASLDAKLAAGVAPDLLLPGGWLMDRLVSVELKRLVQTGFLSRTSKVGLMYYDTEERKRVAAEVVKPLLARLGIPLAAEGSVAPTPDGNARFANLVLSFRSAGVDRVVEIATSPLLFMEAADSQQYYPKYVVDSTYGPAAALEGNAPKAQLAGAQGIGWEPLSDVTGAKTGNPEEATCLQVLTKTGQRSTSPVTTLYQLRFCDAFLFLQSALRGVTGSVDDASLATRAQALGTGYLPAATFRSDFRSGRPDGASAFKDLRYDGTCHCFAYAGALHLAE